MNSFYGDNVRWFIGDVVDIDDPVQIGRVKVRINGLHQDDVADADLPFAQTVIPVTQGGTKELGNYLGVQVGARVFGVFMDGKDSQLPLILGSMPKFEDRTQVVNARPHEAFQAAESGALGTPIPNQVFVANKDFSVASAAIPILNAVSEVTNLPGIPQDVNDAITKVSASTQSSEGSTLYVTLSPCTDCSKLIHQSGIQRVVYSTEYKDTSGVDFLKKAGVQVDYLPSK